MSLFLDIAWYSSGDIHLYTKDLLCPHERPILYSLQTRGHAVLRGSDFHV